MESTELSKMEEKAMKGPSNIALRNTSSVWPSVKPFVNGCLSGQIMFLQSYMEYRFLKDFTSAAEKIDGPHNLAHHKEKLNAFRKNLPKKFFFQATYTTVRFGMFETLTKKVAAANCGRSITLYQEACCGLISGASAASIYCPIAVHMRGQAIEQKWNYRNLIQSLYSSIRKDGFLALWKGSGLYIPQQMALNMGMLASYGRSFKYFEESIGVGRTEAQLGAGVVSAFFAITCKNSCELMFLIKNALRKNAGKKYPYGYIPVLTFEILKPGGRFKFYSDTFKEFVRYAPYCMVQWMILEKIREIEESNGF